MRLVKNMLLKWLEPGQERTERILWLDPAGQVVFTFDLDEPSALPRRRTYEAIVAALDEAEAIVVDRQDIYLLQSEEQFSQKQRQRREQHWALIEPIVTALGAAAFLPEQRGKLVAAVAEQTGRAKCLIYDYLRRYWRGGQMKNVLIPRTDRSGLSRDQALKPEAVKRGAPRAYGQHLGVNIDPLLKKRLEKGYQRFYVSGDCQTLTQAYEPPYGEDLHFDSTPLSTIRFPAHF